MKVLDHGSRFMVGARVLMLKSRNKDGVASQRTVLRTSYNTNQFETQMRSLVGIAAENERIYVSAGPRDIKRAIRLFKERQLASEYDNDPVAFYRELQTRWESCLMHPSAQEEKLWLFDCDDADQHATVCSELEKYYDRPMVPYAYNSKSGHHVITQPFDRTRLSEPVRNLIHDNPIMLWAYS